MGNGGGNKNRIDSRMISEVNVNNNNITNNNNINNNNITNNNNINNNNTNNINLNPNNQSEFDITNLSNYKKKKKKKKRKKKKEKDNSNEEEYELDNNNENEEEENENDNNNNSNIITTNKKNKTKTKNEEIDNEEEEIEEEKNIKTKNLESNIKNTKNSNNNIYNIKTQTNKTKTKKENEESIITDIKNNEEEEDFNYIPEKKIIKLNNNLNYECIQTIEEAHDKEITCLIYLSKTNEIVTSSLNTEIKIWGWKKNKKKIILKSTLTEHKNKIFYLNEFKYLNMFCSCSADKTLKLWDIESLKCIFTLNEHKKSVLTCSYKYSDNENLIFSGGDDKKIIIWEIKIEKKKDKNKTKKENKKETENKNETENKKETQNKNETENKNNSKIKQILKGHLKSITTILYIEILNLLCSGSDDKTIRIWDEKNNFVCIKIINTLNSPIDNLRYSRNRVLVSCEDGYIYFIHMSILKQVRSVQLSKSPVYDFDIMENEKYLIVASCDSIGRIWEIGTSNIALLNGHLNALVSIVNIGELNVATASLDKSIKIWVKK